MVPPNYGLTVGLAGAAEILKAHPSTVKRKARTGEIPGRRIGKPWVFVVEDLLSIIRGKWQDPRRIGQSTQSENPTCRSIEERTRLTGGLSWSAEDERYRQALALPTDVKRSNFTTV